MHYFKRNIGDYHKKAGRLSMIEHGAYTLLMDACYDRERFPTMEEAIDWCWARSDEEIAAVKFVLTKFFTLEGENYTQQRIADEIASFHEKSEKNKQIALDREAKRRAKRAPDEHETCTNGHLTTNQEPLTTNQEPEDQEHVAAEAPTATLDETAPAADKPRRATRLPADWALPKEYLAWALDDRPDFTEALLSREAEKFADHWHAASGKGAAKLDWFATWRNWVRNARVPSNVRPIQQSRFTNLPPVNADELRARAAENARLGVRRANF
ncbi:YdaU family protein [Stutzerimonas stutzeri]|uniref:YdaU family protein n=1 Tax=Stutzerimonas stutzeri TaxID=316 RepID=UPI002659FF05|nr:YdaU family protein [Stutzerimonas stutzeri]MCF6780893.1 YdaU family protein [Stutzerimonas stutzeri]MCF6803463.1 YdaU family protein [Stutzerimonas stutzeri]